MTPEQLEKAMTEKRRKSDSENQKTLRITVWGLLITVASMLMSGVWLISEINSRSKDNKDDIKQVVSTLNVTNDKLDNVANELSSIKGSLNPIAKSNEQQANFNGFIELIVEALNKQKPGSTQNVTVGAK